MQLWILFVALFGLFKGIREPIKKKALEKDSLLGVLFIYTLIGFIMVLPTAHDVLKITPWVFFLICIKSFSIFSAWMSAFISVRKMPVSLYGVIDMSRVLFSTCLGILFLGEKITPKGSIGLITVLLGLFLVNRKKNRKDEDVDLKYIWLTVLSCFLNAISGTLDKYIMSGYEITSAQLQFWFMLLLTLFYGIFILIRREKINLRSCLKNPYIYALSILLVAGDKMLFIANSYPDSKVTVMTLIKQCSVLVTVIAGKLIYKEKNTVYKLICAIVILGGILIAVV